MNVADIGPFSSAIDMVQALRERAISAVELLQMHFDRVERYNGALNAIVALDVDGACGQAAEADRMLANGSAGSLLGLPITVKDAIDVRGLSTTGGLRKRQDHRAERDAPAVASAREAGVVIMGKTNMPPYAGDWQTNNRLFGRTNNPWDLERTPGGSTGGGAAAVAAGLSPLEIGSDIGGSIRIPAAFCGIYGHRPSETLIPRSGHFPGSYLPNVGSILNVLGPLARDAGDLERALDALAGPDAGENIAWTVTVPPARHERLSDFRVAVLPAIDWLPVEPEIMAAIDRLIAALVRSGARVECTSPKAFGDLREVHLLYQVLLTTIFSFNVGGTEEELRRRVDDSIMGDEELAGPARVLLGSAHALLEAYARRERYRQAYREFFKDWDVLIAPVAPVVAFPHHIDSDVEHTFIIDGHTVPYRRLTVYPGLATLCGQPATAFPVGQTKGGLPIGLQAIGPYLEDRTPVRFTQLVAREIGGYEPPPRFT